MSERIKGSYDDALYKLSYTLLYFTYVTKMCRRASNNDNA